MKRLQDVLTAEHDNYILPFFWLQGESQEKILEELEQVYASGIREICIESRTHPDFVGEGWWSDIDFILAEAKKRDMGVWILDDQDFPTGFAVGAFEKEHPEKAKWYLAERHIDIIGPAKDHSVLIQPYIGAEQRPVGVLAVPKPDTETYAVSDKGIIDLTDNIHGDYVFFDLPEGRYRLFVLFLTQKGGGREHYMNLIDEESVRVLIDTVHEPHYQRYQEEFGKTFRGFFNDEPELGNTPGYDFHDTLGDFREKKRLPWSAELEDILKDTWKEDYLKNLIALWYPRGQDTPTIRHQYMDAVTRLVEKNFTGQIGQWCQQRGVSYIGHIIEDDNAHARMGCSIGHYFRQQAGQHMSGIDVVHYQIVPGRNEKMHEWVAGEADGEFFHYGLATLGSSCARIQPNKEGRALCEIFGNYGWAEGVSFMKWLVNHMLVRGINHWTPHAFTPTFPNRDCPPHFYADGNNPQFPYFQELMEYTNRASHLLYGGHSLSECAVLYHGEAEWTTGEAMLYQKPLRQLAERQINGDVVDIDALTGENSRFEGETLHIHTQRYHSLILPYMEFLPATLLPFLQQAKEENFPVYLVDAYPVSDTNGRALSQELVEHLTLVPLESLGQTIETTHGKEVKVAGDYPHLRAFGVQHSDGTVYQFFNEDTHKSCTTEVTLASQKTPESMVVYEETGECYQRALSNSRVPLHLEPGQAVFYLFPKEKMETLETKAPFSAERQQVLSGPWTLSRATVKDYPNWEAVTTFSPEEEFYNLTGPKGDLDFVGTYQYSTVVTLSEETLENTPRIALYLEHLGDVGQVIVNGKKAGSVLSTPHSVEIGALLTPGENHISIEAANTLLYQLKDGVSAFMQLEPTGLTKKPILQFSK